jgi:hypothetical protein
VIQREGYVVQREVWGYPGGSPKVPFGVSVPSSSNDKASSGMLYILFCSTILPLLVSIPINSLTYGFATT